MRAIKSVLVLAFFKTL